MKGCKAWQIIFGIICLFLTITVGTVAVVLFLPYLGGELTNGVFKSAYDSLAEIAKTVGVDGYSIVVWGVVFALPTILLLLATNLLIYGKRSKGIVTGCILALLAFAIGGGVTAWFSEAMFGTHQELFLLVVGCIAIVLLLMFIATLCAVGNAKRKAKSQHTAVDEVAVTVNNSDQAVNQSTDDVLFMAQDYGSVSDVADTTYEHTDVLPQKVLDKLKIARELYEKGAITKEEYLDIVNKYITQQ